MDPGLDGGRLPSSLTIPVSIPRRMPLSDVNVVRFRRPAACGVRPKGTERLVFSLLKEADI
jgi:hypothetical protein